MAKTKNPDKINKDKLIRVRVTKEEHETFMRKAAENGYRSVSDYVRTLIADEAETNNKFKAQFICSIESVDQDTDIIKRYN